MKITIDNREQNRIQSATTYYQSQGLEVQVEELPVGDYLFTNDHNSVVFEFKLIPDFISSIQDNRVFNQAINQAEQYDYHFVIIHGTEQDRAKALALTKHYRPVTVFQYIGALSSLNRYTTVIESYSTYIEEAYFRMLTQARKCLQDKPIVRKFPRKHKNSALNWLCHDVHGINYKTAKRIVDELEISSLEDLFTLEHYRLTNIEGIGDKTADKIMRSIENES